MSKLLKALWTSLKWWIAQDEMDALHRYRYHLQLAKQKLSAFPDATQALDYVEVMAERDPLQLPIDIRELKDRMTQRRYDLLQSIHTFRTTA